MADMSAMGGRLSIFRLGGIRKSPIHPKPSANWTIFVTSAPPPPSFPRKRESICPNQARRLKSGLNRNQRIPSPLMGEG